MVFGESNNFLWFLNLLRTFTLRDTKNTDKNIVSQFTSTRTYKQTEMWSAEKYPEGKLSNKNFSYFSATLFRFIKWRRICFCRGMRENIDLEGEFALSL